MDSRYQHLRHCRQLLSRSRLPQTKKIRLETQLVRISWLLLALEENKPIDQATEETFRDIESQTLELCHTCHNDYLYDSLIGTLNQVSTLLAEAEMSGRSDTAQTVSALIKQEELL